MAQLHRLASPPHAWVFFLLLSFTSATLVRAQQPIGELGPWPSGSFTLLVGMWLAVTCLSETRFDVLPPVMFARMLHKFPVIRRIFTLDRSESVLDHILRRFPMLYNPQRVSLIKQLVFTGINHTGRSVAQEWDALVLVSGGVQYEISGQSVILRLPDHFGGCIESDGKDGQKVLRLQVTTGVDMTKFSKCVDILLKELITPRFPVESHQFSSSLPNDRLLFLWAGLQAYQRHPEQAQFTPDEQDDLLRRGVDYYRPVMDPDDLPLNDSEKKVADIDEMASVPLYISESQCAEKEMLLGAGSAGVLLLTAKQLSVMQGFVQIVCGDWRTPLNPLIFCIWTWMQGKHTLSDSMVVQFSPLIRFVYPQATGAEPNAHSRSAYVLDLSGEYHIDALSHGYFWRFAIWILNFSTAFIITFFAVVSGSKPNLATTLGLLFAQPYTLGSSSFRDIGGLPSWNGRKQVRWGKGFKCGLFSGKYHRKQGPSGNSCFRASILYAASWVVWRFRFRLRTVLRFGQQGPSPEWVLVAAYILEIMALAVWCMGFWGTLRYQVNLIQAIAFIITLSYLAISIHNMDYNDPAARAWWFFWYSELGILCTVPWVAIIHCGPGPACGSVRVYNAAIWIHIIASSYFSPN